MTLLAQMAADDSATPTATAKEHKGSLEIISDVNEENIENFVD